MARASATSATSTQLTYDNVARHNTENDLFIVIHDQVYDVSNWSKEHPGGKRVLMGFGGEHGPLPSCEWAPAHGRSDLPGKDATDAFEDVGHSAHAREIMKTYAIGGLLRRVRFPSVIYR
jgi:cytochrome b involved in lipid metabolism